MGVIDQVPEFSSTHLDTMLSFVHSLRSSQDPTVSLIPNVFCFLNERIVFLVSIVTVSVIV